MKTIFGHIENLVVDNKISLQSIMRIVTDKLKKAFPEIHEAFKALDTDRLAPVMEKLNKKYSYDDLRIARMFLEK